MASPLKAVCRVSWQNRIDKASRPAIEQCCIVTTTNTVAAFFGLLCNIVSNLSLIQYNPAACFFGEL